MAQQQVAVLPPRGIPPPVTEAPLVTSELDKEWETLNELINLEGQVLQTPVSNTQVVREVFSTIVSGTVETEHLPIAPSSELLLGVEEIPPLDVFYSPQHKAVVRRQRKKRKLENALAQNAEHLDVLWKDPNNNPTENLTKLSQIAGAYASATINKASEVQQLLKERESQIQLLQQQLRQANENTEASKQLEELQESFRQMQVSHQRSIEEKEKQLQTVQEMPKDEPKLTEFISEPIGLNDQLSQQQEEMVRKISQWREFCEISDKITSQVVELRNDYDQTNKRITEYLAWKNDEEGKRAGAPKINENHKELLFNKWDEQITQAEQAAESAATQATILIDCVNENLHRANLVSESTPGYLPIASQLEDEWKQKAQANGETIRALSRLNWESYWTYLSPTANA